MKSKKSPCIDIFKFISKNGYEQIKNNNLLKKIVLDEIEYYKFLIQI